VSYESVRLWCNKFGTLFSKRLKRRHPGFGDTFFIDEVFVTIAGRRHYLSRAVDQDGDVVDVYLQARRNAEAAKRFFRRLLRSHGTSPRKIVTDKLGSYGVARRALMPETIHSNDRYANNRAELSHQPTRARERGMRRFSSPEQAPRFLSAHAVVYNLFNLQRHLTSASFYRLHRRALSNAGTMLLRREVRWQASPRPVPLTCQCRAAARPAPDSTATRLVVSPECRPAFRIGCI
jgi:putative transposase